jgi:uncharacterized RDD family membrane protein YckC
MKCPKCGYLGFETTDRCRNCQYDFSLTPFATELELALQSAESRHEGSANFELPAIERQTDSVGANALDLDRLFGEAETHESRAEAVLPVEPVEPVAPAEPFDSLPFDDAPIVFPPAAPPPLAVRRATGEAPRHRPRTPRPIKPQPLQLEPEPAPRVSPAETVALLMETPPLSARLGAGAIDALLLIGLDAAIVYLTLRVAGLANTIDDVRVLPPIPFGAFLILLAFGYLATFNVAGGQTIGKMLMNLRVIGDDGHRIDPASGMLRAAGCMLVPVSLGLSYVPVLVTSDHRALHDRLAGTRVVRD